MFKVLEFFMLIDIYLFGIAINTYLSDKKIVG